MSFPMPNTKLAGSVVVASCYYRELSDRDKKFIPADDNWPDTVYLVLLLNEQMPFFTVALVADNEFNSYDVLLAESKMNIVEAVNEVYTQWGGDI